MLDAAVIRVLAAFMSFGTVAGILAFSRGGAHVAGGRHTEWRAADNPPKVLQVVWPVVTFVPQVYPFLVAAVPEWAYEASPRFSFSGDSFAQVFGFLLWGLGGLLVLWSARTLGRFMVIQIAVATDHELVDRGPYAYIRHPTYTGAVCLALGMSLLFLSYALLAFTVVTVIIATYRARKEERLLASRAGLGETYREYMTRTGRFLPRLTR